VFSYAADLWAVHRPVHASYVQVAQMVLSVPAEGYGVGDKYRWRSKGTPTTMHDVGTGIHITQAARVEVTFTDLGSWRVQISLPGSGIVLLLGISGLP
jgi:hypothetical protein